ncbi:MAG: VanZ family protein [Lachnospiraceae bacterium]|nr:VanZ family protein [Lachnospiraceae bacterium]
MKKNYFLRILSALLLIGCIIFIFHNSLQPGVVSEAKSEGTTGFLRKILGVVMSKFLEDDHYVRKLAHVFEFAVLGILAMVNIKVWNVVKRQYYIGGLCFGVLIGAIDETIQLFVPGRSGMFTDVLIDFSGFVVGFFLCLMLSLWYNKSQCAKKST